MEKIDKQQLNKLFNLLEEKNVKSSWITSICDVDSLLELNTLQYNLLLALLQKIF